MLIVTPFQQTVLVFGTLLTKQYLLWLLVSSWDRERQCSTCVTLG